MKKKTKNTIVALTGAGALASFVVGVAPQLKGASMTPDSTNAFLGGDAVSGLKGLRAAGDDDGEKKSKKGKKVKKVKKVRSPKKFKA